MAWRWLFSPLRAHNNAIPPHAPRLAGVVYVQEPRYDTSSLLQWFELSSRALGAYFCAYTSCVVCPVACDESGRAGGSAAPAKGVALSEPGVAMSRAPYGL